MIRCFGLDLTRARAAERCSGYGKEHCEQYCNMEETTSKGLIRVGVREWKEKGERGSCKECVA